MLSFLTIGTNVIARTRLSDTNTRARPLPYGPLRVQLQAAPEPSRRSRALSPRESVLLIILASFVGRIILAATIGLGIDESYQAAVSRPLSLSYFDHSPFSFWIPGIVTSLTGSASGVVLRLPFILMFVGTTWMMYRLTARLFGERAGAIAALILNIVPVLSVSAGGWVLPDGPLMFWMLACALCLEHVLLPSREGTHAARTRTLWWLAGGACAGLAMLSKYHGVFLFAGIGLFVLTNRYARRSLMHPGPYLGALVAAFIVSPVLIWNAQHAWISFRFQGGRGTTSGLHLFSFLENIGGQLGYLLPWIGIPLAWVLCSVMIEAARGARAKDKSRSSAARWWLACLAIGPIASFTLIALGGHRGLPHWQAPGWLMVIPLLAERVDARLTRSSAKTRRNTRAWLMASTIAFVVVIVALATELRLGVVHRLAPSLFSRRDPATELIDWRELPGTIAPMLRPSNDGTHERPFVAATNWMDAAKISYALNGEADVVCLCTEPHHFAFVRRGSSYLSRDAIIVERAGLRHATSVPLAKYFRSVTPIGSTVIRRGGVPAMTLELYRGETLVSDVPARMP